MKNVVYIVLALLVLNIFSTIALSKVEEQIYSTQGIEIDKSIEISSTPQDIKNEQIRNKNRSKKYIKNKKKLSKLDFKQRVKQKELEHIEKRLKSKKLKLESLTTSEEKGE